MRAIPVVVVVLLICAGVSAAEAPVLVRVEVGDRAEARQVGKILDLDERTMGNVLYGWGTAEEIEMVESLGFVVEPVAPAPRDPEALTMCSDPIGPPFSWNCYPTWPQYESMMSHYATAYSSIARLVNLGVSGQGDHELWALKISDNPDAEENEPEILYTNTMHGDELVCYGTSLHLIDHILSSYGSDPQVTRLVDETVLWINPLCNPDGTFAGGDHTVASSQRYLPATGVDPNRSFPDPSVPDDPAAPGWPAEVQRMIDLADAEHFTIAANCHGGAELFNYPWDVWTFRTPDDSWWIDAGIGYAQSAHDASPAGYFTDNGSGFDYPGVTNGANWYVVSGGRQDFMNWYHGCREVTLELSGVKPLDASQLDAHFNYNRQALLDYFSLALTGIRGVVTDADTTLPVTAEVRVTGHDDEGQRSWVSTDPDVGDYHRLLDPGTWDLVFSADGYAPEIVTGVVVQPDQDATVVDVELHAAQQVLLTGQITEEGTGAPVSGASVTLVGSSHPPAVTDGSGGYSIADVWEGIYTFRVEATGYRAIEDERLVVSGSTVQSFVLSEAVTLAADDFEADDGGFTASAGWGWGTDPVTGAHSGAKVWGTVIGGNYSDNVSWTLDAPAVVIPAGADAELRYWQWFDIEGSGYDGGNIKVSADGGPFAVVDPIPAYNDSSVNGLGGEPGFNGSSGWHEVTVDLSAFAGQTIVIRWTLGTDFSQTRRGWYIDDVSVLAWGMTTDTTIFTDGFESGDTTAWNGVVR